MPRTVSPQGRREVLGLDLITAEVEEGWTQFFKDLKERGLSGVRLAISDAHGGWRNAVRNVLKAEWQRCKVHFYRNVLVHVPKRSQAEVSEAMKADWPALELSAHGSMKWILACHGGRDCQARERI